MAQLITKAKEIIIYAYPNDNDNPFSKPSSSSLWMPRAGQSLDYVIADTLSVTQDDPEEQTFEFETTDTPETFYTAGAYNVDLNNAELSDWFVEKILGWSKISEPEGFISPETYSARYIALQVKFADDCYFVIPKMSIAPKLVMESVKTSLVYGTLSGKATNGNIFGKKTSIAKLKNPLLASYT